MESILAMIFLGYFMYAGYISYCLIAMSAQVVFTFFIEKKQIWKIAIMVFLTQGLVVQISEISCDIIESINTCKNLGFWSVVTSESFKFEIFYGLLLTGIIIMIGYFTYRSIDGKINYKKWVALIIGYLINILIMVFMIYKFGIMIGGF